MQKKVSVIALSLAAALALAGCANDGTRYRADTYYAGQVNQVQEVNTVQIIAVNAARVAVPNDDNRDTARMTGAILGAIAGAAIGNHNNHSTSARVMGGLAGGAVGGLAGDAVGGSSSTSYTDGVQIVFRTASGKVLQSAQGRPSLRIQDRHGRYGVTHAQRSAHSAQQPLRLRPLILTLSRLKRIE